MPIVERNCEAFEPKDLSETRIGGARPKLIENCKSPSHLKENEKEDEISCNLGNFELRNEDKINKIPWGTQPLGIATRDTNIVNLDGFIKENSYAQSSLRLLNPSCKNECPSSNEINTCNSCAIPCLEDTSRELLELSPEMDFLEIDFDPNLTNTTLGWKNCLEFAHTGVNVPIMLPTRETNEENGNMIEVCEQIAFLKNKDISEQNNNENLPFESNKSVLHKCSHCRTLDSLVNDHSSPKCSGHCSGLKLKSGDYFREEFNLDGLGAVCHKSLLSNKFSHSNLIAESSQFSKRNLRDDCVCTYKSHDSDICKKKCDISEITNLLSNYDATIEIVPVSEGNRASALSEPTPDHLSVKAPGRAKQVEKCMIWSELCAPLKQYDQIGKSACGPTALLNVMDALNFKVSLKSISSVIEARQRKEKAPIVEYLFSRSIAGTDHTDLIVAAGLASGGEVLGKFFHMYPRRTVDLVPWLGEWIHKGAVPVLTLNLQRGGQPGALIADAWHHQMVYGVGPSGVYLTNPLGCVTQSELEEQLCSPSELLIRRADIVGRWREDSDLKGLIQGLSSPWTKLNVLGQVVSVLREAFLKGPDNIKSEFQASSKKSVTSHIKIPAIYKSGVTLFIKKDNPHLNFLNSLEELPYFDS